MFTVVGMLAWGYLVDRFGRKAGMFSASAIIIIFTALSAGAYGAGGSVKGMLQALIAYRCLSGVGIGGEFLISTRNHSFISPSSRS